MAGLCEDCTGCCTVFEVKDIGKPFGAACQYLGATAFGRGCTIYAERPQPCKNYVCLWLDSQRRQEPADRLPEALKPEACKVVMGWPWGEDRDTLFVYPYPGYEGAWRKPPVAEHLRMILSRGGKVVVVTGATRIAIKGDMAFVGTEEEFAQLLS
jgi:hypothetical protein